MLQIPKDNKGFFEVGQLHFDLLPESCEFQIGKFSREFYSTITARAQDPKAGLDFEVLCEYGDEGKVGFSFDAHGINDNGIPTGVFNFDQGKTNAPYFMDMILEGFDSALDFYGTLNLNKGWVLISGELKHGWENKPPLKVSIATKFETEQLNWSHYCFTSLEETEGIDPIEVQFLSLTNPTFKKLPQKIFEFRNLKELSIIQNSENWMEEKLPLQEIQEQFGDLNQLTQFHLNGASLKNLPESIGELKNLKNLSLNNCLLTHIPSGIWKLPKLEYLYLQNNRLESIPEQIELPELKVLTVSENLLKTLPESLADQPQLKTLELEGNPWEFLPEAYNAIEKINLSIVDKQRLLNFDYSGADGKGVTVWNEAIFLSKKDPELRTQIESVIQDHHLEKHSKALMHLIKKAIGFDHVKPENYTEVGNHRFGGMPDLPLSMPYPRFGDNWRDGKGDYVYEFIAQINCEAIAHLQDYLPKTGVLFFFLETIHNLYEGENQPVKVIYVPTFSELETGKRFHFTEEDYFEMLGTGYQGFQANAKKMNSAPSFYASYPNNYLFNHDAEGLEEDEQLLEVLYDSFEVPLNDLNPFDHAINAHAFTQHESPELQASLDLKGNPEDWMILLTVKSRGDMQWGDAGDLFFVIHKSDLAKADFSNVFVTMESS